MEQFSQKCLLCTSSGPDLIEIFGLLGSSLKISEIINKYFWFELKEQENTDLLSICQSCWHSTRCFHEFYCRIEEIYSQKTLIDAKTCIKNEIINSDEDIVQGQSLQIVECLSVSIKPDIESLSVLTTEKNPIEYDFQQEETDVDDCSKKEQRQCSSTAKGKRALQLERIKQFFDMKCTLCTQTFQDCTDIRVHYRDKHDQQGYLLCCGSKIMAQPSWLLQHIKLHVNPLDFSCPICQKSVSTKQSLQRHMTTHDPQAKSNFICDKCGKGFGVKGRLRAHVLTHIKGDDRPSVMCHICDKRFVSNSSLSLHTRNIHENTESFVCDICAKIFRTRALLRLHSETHITTGRIKCNVCNLSLKNKKTLKTHLQTHSTAKTDQICTICGKVMQNKTALKNHMRNVHVEAIHKCNFCDKRFKDLKYFKQHMASHTGERLYPCSYCPKAFAFESNMRKHRERKHLQDWLVDKEKRNSIH